MSTVDRRWSNHKFEVWYWVYMKGLGLENLLTCHDKIQGELIRSWVQFKSRFCFFQGLSWYVFCESLILAGLSHLPPHQDISQDTWDFIQVSNSQQSPNTAEKGASSQYWALKDLTNQYNRSETFYYFQNIRKKIISTKRHVLPGRSAGLEILWEEL